MPSRGALRHSLFILNLTELKKVASEQSPLSELVKDLGEDGRLSFCDLAEMTSHDEKLLSTLTTKYIQALCENVKARFKDSLPI